MTTAMISWSLKLVKSDLLGKNPQISIFVSFFDFTRFTIVT
ncbi:hypothetical protein Nizo2535_0963 [Lactiplantibacillus plantarum]|nr:hypothetical protein Nizo2535_0963 [Lactiplantibacillus plantarum]KZU76120.1 hypothetical protein Nizo2891_2748 [Lactiplantibacillus plantarum]